MFKVSQHRTLTARDLIAGFFLQHPLGSSSEVTEHLQGLKFGISVVSVKRHLSQLVKDGTLAVQGSGPATKYRITINGRLFADVAAQEYCADEPDRRYGLATYNHELFPDLPDRIMTDSEITDLDAATAAYRNRIKTQTEVTHRKELERFVIELSWKSSQIEGNTYSILDTERLLQEGITASKHPQEEAAMILNHKEAFQDILQRRDEFKTLTRRNLEGLHAILTQNLGVARNLRTGLVGVTGSRYRPLDNQFQIQEAVEALSRAASRLSTGYEKALLALLGISYIQPFEDGNKRTARLMANAILLAHGLSPLSYRSVDKEAYREAMLVFYELNSLMPSKKIFMQQYSFAAENYAVG